MSKTRSCAVFLAFPFTVSVCSLLAVESTHLDSVTLVAVCPASCMAVSWPKAITAAHTERIGKIVSFIFIVLSLWCVWVVVRGIGIGMLCIRDDVRDAPV